MSGGRTLVVGLVNPLRGDDAAGWAVVEQLATRVDESAVDLRTVHQLLPELADPVSRARRAVFVDAAVGEHPGAVEVREVAPALPEGIFSHHMSPASLLALARALYGAAPAAFVVTITAQQFELEGPLAGAVRDALPKAVDAILALL